MNTTTHQHSADLDAVKKDLAALRDDLASLSRSVVREGARTARDAKESVKESVKDSVERASAQVDHLIESRPYTTLLVAFTAGLFASALIRRL